VWAALVGALLVAVHPSAVWFSTFPVSESLYAVLLTAGAYFFLRARLDKSRWYAAVAGITFGLLLMVRGNGMLLVPIVAVLWLASALSDDDETFRVQRTLTGVALASISVAYLYDVRYLDKYFVNKQLHEFLPNVAFRVANHVHWLSWSWSLLAAIIVLLAGTIFVGNLLRRWAQHVDAFRWCTIAAVAVAIVAIVIVSPRGLGDALLRWGPLVLLLSLGGLVLVLMRPTRYLDAGTTLFIVLGIVTYSTLFASRHKAPMSAPYYLYWDRYLFSEVFPLAIVLALIGLRALSEWLVVREPRRTLAIAVAAMLGGVLLVPDVVETRKATRATLFGDAYGTLAKLDAMTRTDGHKPAIVYSGLATMPPNWTAFDTSRAFALPLFQTFRRNIVGSTFKPPALDYVYDPIGARNTLAAHHLPSGYLVAVRAPDAQPFPNDAHTQYVGTVDYTAPVIARAVNRSDEEFRDARFKFDVYAITR
jgi:4-amino-4-deoxy-L-arabinose transferase-like glycosyltransferase